MTEFWRLFLYIGGGLIFTVSVLDSLIRAIKHYKKGKKTVGKSFDNRVKNILTEERRISCPLIINAERDSQSRKLELSLLKDTIVAELKPIRKDIHEIKDLTLKLHHSQMTDLQIKLGHLYNNKFDVKGTLSKADQTNWDKWFSDYTALGGNSDIKRMDDLIQAARVAVTLGKANKNKGEGEQ